MVWTEVSESGSANQITQVHFVEFFKNNTGDCITFRPTHPNTSGINSYKSNLLQIITIIMINFGTSSPIEKKKKPYDCTNVIFPVIMSKIYRESERTQLKETGISQKKRPSFFINFLELNRSFTVSAVTDNKFWLVTTVIISYDLIHLVWHNVQFCLHVPITFSNWGIEVQYSRV